MLEKYIHSHPHCPLLPAWIGNAPAGCFDLE
jgi:hypothetical protein